ncbi:MAG TPA: VIT1/CCC1 transporter family protein [Anaerolineaceae bacterium]|jgi:vacuolar iron transporter family protein
MKTKQEDKFIKDLQKALLQERAAWRLYHALANAEKNLPRRKVLIKLAKTEEAHDERWTARLKELGAEVPPDRETIFERIWRWVLVQSGTDNALKRIEDAEEEGSSLYEEMSQIAPSEGDRVALDAVQKEEEMHGRVAHKVISSTPIAIDPQGMLDTILKREHWHKRGGGWIGQAIYGANDGLGSVFGIVSGVAGATAGGGSAVLIAGLAGMLASALSMGSGAYLSTKAEREVNEAEIARERRELQSKPEEEMEELSLFYQLKGVPEEEANVLAQRLFSQPDQALKTLVSEELGLSEQTFPNAWMAALSATLSTAFGAFIPIVPFFFISGYPAIITSFTISTIAHFMIGSAKTVVTGLSPWRSGLEMMVIGLGEAMITYGIGLLFGAMAK